MKWLAAILVSILLFCSSIRAQYWHQTGILPVPQFSDNGFLDQIAIFHQDTMFAFREFYFSQTQEIFFSANGGKSWIDTKNQTPSTGKTVITGVGTMIHAPVFESFSDSVGIYRSVNFGKDWVKTFDRQVITLIKGQDDNYYLIAYDSKTALDKIFRSSDDGRSWNDFLDPLDPISQVIVRADHRIFLNAYPRILRSSDNGASWDTVFSQGADLLVADDSLLYLNSYDGNFYISKSGDPDTWIKRSASPFTHISITDIAVHHGILLIPPLVSRDTGLTWSSLLIDSLYSTIGNRRRGIGIDSSGTCFYGVADYVYRSIDSGKTWGRRIPLADDSYYGSLPMIASTGNDLWILNGPIIYRSNDDGLNFAKVSDSRFRYFSALGAGSNGSVVVAGEDTANKFIIGKTTDQGASWSVSSPVATNNSIFYVGERAPGKFVAIDVNGYCNHSEDNGVSWKAVQASSSPTDISAFFIADSLDLYAAARGGFFVSRTGGLSWKSNNTPEPTNTATSIASGPGGAILAVFDSVSLMRSTDEGYSWLPWGDGIPKCRITGITLVADSSLYVSTSNGVYYQAAGDNTWLEANVGLNDPYVLNITSYNGTTLFVSCANTEIFKAENVAAVSSRNSDVGESGVSIFPNPVSNSATFQYSLSKREYVKLELLDQIGRSIRTLREAKENAGISTFLFSISDLSPGIYFLQVRSDTGFRRSKFIVIR
ncbi:MAG: T9SS type A sorting domain-containing protein [Bacteroidota bacterium]|nr:T9SS type A sorting domain-containing protein [Bacteroidota bacterium]MDP4229781.1 T9SS type A sorting domain-containing protein [Bacteroidota bacterium]MDP4237156.1 T9SS type A sorting domain-containing protein [Bacteroidota bacterium]